MRAFVAGATGVIGSRVVALLVDGGWIVAGMTRSAEKAAALADLGVRPMVCDVYDVASLNRAVLAFHPDVLVDELTDLPDDASKIADGAGANARIRREGTANLLVAASAAGTTRFVAQSVAWHLPGDSGTAVADLEAMVLAHGGIVLRYGRFYGAGTYHQELPPPPRVHIDVAARQTVAALQRPSGIITILDPLYDAAGG